MRFDELIHPVSFEEFRKTYWGARSLVGSGGGNRFADLIGLRDLGRLIRYMRPRPPAGIALVKGSRLYDRRWTYEDGTPRLEDVRAAWRDGYTIVINQVERFWEPVAKLTGLLGADLNHPVNVNLYASPPGTQGFVPHFDVMDTFILQVEGTKAWEVREAAIRSPMPDEQRTIAADNLPPLVWEGELVPGSLLYIPRGHVHAARTTTSASLHLTVGVQSVTWLDLLTAAVSSARTDPRLREALPPGFLTNPGDLGGTLDEIVRALPPLLRLEPALNRLADRLLTNAQSLDGDLIASDSDIALDTPLRRRPGVAARVLEGEGRFAIQFSGGKIEGPEKIGPALRHVVGTDSFVAGTLPGQLNDREKLVLARRLVREGLLEIGAQG